MRYCVQVGEFHPQFKKYWFLSNLHTIKYTNYIPWQLSQTTMSGYSVNYELLTWVAVCQKRTNRQQNLWNSQSRAPVVFQDVQTDDSLTVDVAVINSGTESNLESQHKRQRESHSVLARDPAPCLWAAAAAPGGLPVLQSFFARFLKRDYSTEECIFTVVMATFKKFTMEIFVA